MSNRLRNMVAAMIFIVLANASALHAESPLPPPGAKDKCPVCGMFVRGYPNWLAAVRLENGELFYFDGPKDMMTFYLNPEKYGLTSSRFKAAEVVVKDYYSLKSIDARKAFFVSGSNVTGPMGKELVPFARKTEAEEFLQDHQGKTIYEFQGISPDLLHSLE